MERPQKGEKQERGEGFACGRNETFPVQLLVPVIEEVFRRVPGSEARVALFGRMEEFCLPKMEEVLPDTWIMKHQLTKRIWYLCFLEEEPKNYRQYNAAVEVEREARNEIDAIRAVLEERNIHPGTDGGVVEGEKVPCLAGCTDFETAVQIWKKYAFPWRFRGGAIFTLRFPERVSSSYPVARRQNPLRFLLSRLACTMRMIYGSGNHSRKN